MQISHGAAQRIVEHVAAHFHCQVWVTNTSAQVLASSWPTASEPALLIDADDLRPEEADGYLALPLQYASEVVGRLVLRNELGLEQELAHAAKIVAELILRQSLDVEPLLDQQWALNRFVYELLFADELQKSEAVILQEAKLLAIDIATPRVVVVIHVAAYLDQLQRGTPYPTPDLNGYRRQRQQLRRRLLKQVGAALPGSEASVCAFLDEQQLVLLAAIDSESASQWRHNLKAAVQRFLDEADRPSSRLLLAGVGDYYPGWRSLTDSYRDARLAMEIGRTLPDQGNVFTVADLGLAAYVYGGSPKTTARLAERILHPLSDHPDLLETLSTFLEMSLSPSAAAQSLGVHRHTLTYRLARVAELTGLDPNNFAAATQFYAALLRLKADSGQTH